MYYCNTPRRDVNYININEILDPLFFEMENLKDRHKKMQCKVCGKCIRSDNMKRHARTHQDILSMTEDEAREELRRRNESFLEREEKFKN